MTAPLAASNIVGILEDGTPRANFLPADTHQVLHLVRASDQRINFRAFRSGGSPLNLKDWLLVATVKQSTDLALSALISRFGFQDLFKGQNYAYFDIADSDTARLPYGRYVWDIRGRYQGLWYELMPASPLWLEPGVGLPGAPLTAVSPVVLYVADPPLIDSFALVGSPLVLEVGNTLVNPLFAAAYQPYPGAPTGVDLSDGTHTVALASPYNAGVLPYSYVEDVPNDTQVFTLAAHQPGGLPDATALVTVSWQPEVLWGTAVPGTYNAAFIQALSDSALQPSRAGNPGFSAGAGELIYVALPSSYGGSPGDFVNAATGFVLGVTKVASAVAVTNAYSVTLPYDLWASNVAALGAITLRITG